MQGILVLYSSNVTHYKTFPASNNLLMHQMVGGSIPARALAFFLFFFSFLVPLFHSNHMLNEFIRWPARLAHASAQTQWRKQLIQQLVFVGFGGKY
jgi:hypothetical protein